MDVFQECLQKIRARCAIQDDEYWDLALEEGEIPIATERDDWISLSSKEGFVVGFGLQNGSFDVGVTLPPGFNHDELELSAIMIPSRLQFNFKEQTYWWDYRLFFDANLERPLETQHRDCYVSGPVQIMDTCRSLIQELKAKKHKSPVETFRKNLHYMRDLSAIQDDPYWDLKLEEGETPIPSEHNSRTLKIQTKEDIMVQMGFNDYCTCGYIYGHIRLPSSFHITREEVLSIMGSKVELDGLNMEQDDIYKWKKERYDDALMSFPLALQPNKRVSGPVQVMEEARGVIRAVMAAESELCMNKKREMTETIREELMMNACHPRRVAVWTEQEFDPF